MYEYKIVKHGVDKIGRIRPEGVEQEINKIASEREWELVNVSWPGVNGAFSVWRKKRE